MRWARTATAHSFRTPLTLAFGHGSVQRCQVVRLGEAEPRVEGGYSERLQDEAKRTDPTNDHRHTKRLDGVGELDEARELLEAVAYGIKPECLKVDAVDRIVEEMSYDVVGSGHCLGTWSHESQQRLTVQFCSSVGGAGGAQYRVVGGQPSVKIGVKQRQPRRDVHVAADALLELQRPAR